MSETTIPYLIKRKRKGRHSCTTDALRKAQLEVKIFMALDQHPNITTVSQLAQLINEEPSTISAHVNLLKKNGWIINCDPHSTGWKIGEGGNE
jgi:DNA-binding MarR family transcriptional regulator